ncbi:hypothetical protein JHK85_023260 [Glycine max]|uniref:Uncharacterized protein n=1 Tax=Glycine max TaxID=3847 RepID=K7L9C5_SOYBN|nr:hypothetical protein JHK87_022669 [Glycine soja]KAG5017124.1 hypothetical protein JHK85_023260 [Glycine max]
MSQSRPNEDEPIDATPISFCVSYDYDVNCGDVVGNPTNLNETPSLTQSSRPKKGRRSKPLPDEWMKNWEVERFDKGVERYENEGIRIRRQKVKTQDKEESNRKTKEETKVSVLTFKMKSSSSQQIPHHIFSNTSFTIG